MIENNAMPDSDFSDYNGDLYDAPSGWHWAEDRDNGFPDSQEEVCEEAGWDVDNFKYYGYEVRSSIGTAMHLFKFPASDLFANSILFFSKAQSTSSVSAVFP